MLEKELAHHDARQEVVRCRTLRRESEESVVYTEEQVKSIAVLEPKADVTRRLKEGYQWLHKRTLVQNIFKSTKKLI